MTLQRDRVTAAFELAVKQVGVLVNATPLWWDYINYVQAWREDESSSYPGSALAEAGGKMATLRKVYHRAVLVPLVSVCVCVCVIMCKCEERMISFIHTHTHTNTHTHTHIYINRTASTSSGVPTRHGKTLSTNTQPDRHSPSSNRAIIKRRAWQGRGRRLWIC